MTDTDPNESGTFSEEETVARREAALKRAFATPHKPHKPSFAGKLVKHKPVPDKGE